MNPHISSIFLWNLCFYCANCVVTSTHSKYEDISTLASLFSVSDVEYEENGNIPLDNLPSIGNGHIATVAYSDTVFLNGLYNGKNGSSHRARIPPGNNIRVAQTDKTQQGPIPHNLTLNVENAIFYENWNLSENITVEQRTFAHRHFTKLIVTQIQINNRNLQDDVILRISNRHGDGYNDNSSDLKSPIRGQTLLGSGVQASYMCAEIQQVEDDRYPERIVKNVCTISSHLPSTINCTRNSSTVQTFITGYGSSLEEIENDFNSVSSLILAGKHFEIEQSHVTTWQSIWTTGVIHVEGDVHLAKVVYGCLYYILSSLPSPSSKTHSPSRPFYGLSPSGLAYGSLGKDYQGHTFWDGETWMFPPILYFHPEAAKQMLNYRLAGLQAARDNAKSTGFKGARFPWESAGTGAEVSPDNLSDGARYQIHITSDISFAIRQYIAMTRDIPWLQKYNERIESESNGCELLRDIAEYWTSRASYNSTTGYYDINDIMSPDEDHNHGNNNGFTNIGAGYSIFYAKYAECLCGGSDYMAGGGVPDEWVELAKSLKLNYDEDKNYHPEYEGYQFGTPIKQADVVLMGFPLLYEMSGETRKKDVLIYTNVSRENGPAMTWSMHTIGFLELDDEVEAEKMFNRSYQWYVDGPFKMWREWLPWRVPPTEYTPAQNFITGMGGFLQSLLSGYGGIKVYTEKIVIRKPRLPPGGSTTLVFRGIKYLGNEIDVEISKTELKLRLRRISIHFPLEIKKNDEPPIKFSREFSISLKDNPDLELNIFTSTPTNCPLPFDKIGMPYSNSKLSPGMSDSIISSWVKNLKLSNHLTKKHEKSLDPGKGNEINDYSAPSSSMESQRLYM